MASQRDIRRRIGAVKNIKQITRAMQFVAASKLKRAQDATLAARPYSEKLDEVLADLASVLGGEDHPLLASPRGRQAPDRAHHHGPRRWPARSTPTPSGSCRATSSTSPATSPLITVGRKGRDAMRRSGVPIEAHFAAFGDRPTFADVLPLARLDHRRLPRRHVYAASTSSTAASCRRSSSARS